MRLARIAAAVLLWFFALLLWAQNAPWYQTHFPPEEFRERWNKVFDAIGNNAIAVLQGMPMTNGFQLPRQNNEFYYLCGVETPHSYLLLDGRTRKVTLFLPPRNPRIESAEGKVLSAEDADLAKELIGVDAVRSTEDMKKSDWLGGGGFGRGGALTIYTPFSPAEGAEQSRGELQAGNTAILNDYWNGRLPREVHFVSLLQARNPRAKVADLSPILDEMRAVKSAREIALIRRAAQLAALGLVEAMRSTRPGVYEYQLEAAARYIFVVNGARLEGYRSITASGTPNIWNMHYYRNNKQMEAGDLVLMDYAPDYHYYTADIGRMWPVSGTYLPWQRELVGFVLAYRNTVMERVRPGVTAQQIQAEAKQAMEAVFARTKFSKPVYEQAAHRLVDTGGGIFSHPVGMAVHDDGEYIRGPLRPGHVIAFDPQMRVPEENLYIRYEDLLVITKEGYENLTAVAPCKLEDIEKLVQQGGGVVQKFPPMRIE